jgi:hypothetical protein
MVKRVLRLKKGGVLTAPLMPESEMMRKERIAHHKAVNEEITKSLKDMNKHLEKPATPAKKAEPAHQRSSQAFYAPLHHMKPIRDDTDKLAHIKRSASIETQTMPVHFKSEKAVTKDMLMAEKNKEVAKLMKQGLSRKQASAKVNEK